MRLHQFKRMLKASACGAALLLLGVGSASAAPATVKLTAGPGTVTLPDGTGVPMWGYACGTSAGADCHALNQNSSGWSPIVITVPTGTDLTINLTNQLPLVDGKPIPTSIMIVGQLGGGLGTKSVSTDSPSHMTQGTTWPIADPTTTFTPPTQGQRVQSFGTEVTDTPLDLPVWSNLRPGTYLLESGTHPSIQASMGLIGMLVVTDAANGVAYPGVNYTADLPLLFSEIDPVQNNAVATAVATPGFVESATHGVSASRSIVSFTVLNPGSGYSALTPPQVTISGGGGAAAHAVVSSTGQVTAVLLDTQGSYSSAPTVSIDFPNPADPTVGQRAVVAANLQSNCNTANGTAAACYPSVVNYSPRYFLINGQAFDITNASHSLFNASANVGPTAGPVVVRMVNAGSRMHIPSIVGSTINTKPGFGLVAEDGNPVPGVTRIQSEIFMAAGKTYDVKIDGLLSSAQALPVFDRQLSLSGNGGARNAGMLAYISVNGNSLPTAATAQANVTAKANLDTYNAVVPGHTLAISDPAKGVIANDVNILGVQLITSPSHGAVVLNTDGTFTYAPDSSWTGTTQDSFNYCGNGASTGPACAEVDLNTSALISDTFTACPKTSTGAFTCVFHSNVATALSVKAPGLLTNAVDAANLTFTVDDTSFVVDSATPGLTVSLSKDGSFIASAPAAGTYNFSFKATNSVGTSTTGYAQVVFPTGSGLNVTVLDGSDKKTVITSYRWIIEEDRTFFVDPSCALNPASCPAVTSGGTLPNFATNFHTSFMPVIATGCTDDAACGNDQTVGGVKTQQHYKSSPGDIALCDGTLPAGTPCLDPKKRYYISVLPGDAAQPFINGYAGAPDCSMAGVAAGSCGHGMGGAPIAKGQHDSSQSIMVVTEPSPYPPATLSVFVFEDDYPLNGEHDAGGGIDVLSPNEPGLGGFQITIQDQAGGTGDATGTPTYDMFNMPLSNSLVGTIDPVTKLDACPVSPQVTQNVQGTAPDATPAQCAADPTLKSCQKGVVGMIITCPKYESDGKTLSPLAGQALVKNLYQGRYGVIANPGADREGRGEEWLQTNTLDGQKAHDSFMRIGEPAYFQEFGPAGYHVTIGFANPKIINDRRSNAQKTGLCDTDPSPAGADCNHEVTGHVTTARMSRPSDERLYGSGDHSQFGFTQTYVSLGDPDGAEFMFQKTDENGNFDFKSVPRGNWKITTFDQWNDQIVDGITTPVAMCDPNSLQPGNTPNCKSTVDMGEVADHQWQADIYTRTFFDLDYSGVSDDSKPGLTMVDTNIRFRDGSFSNFNSTDLSGNAGFNEVFPLFNWYVIETDSTRYKNSGTHVVYDAGGPADGTAPLVGTPPTPAPCAGSTSTKPCGTSQIADHMANTYEPNPVPADLSVPGAVYCTLAVTADCTGETVGNGPKPWDSQSLMSSGRIDPAWVDSYGWQGFLGQSNFLEFGKRPFAEGENGGIHGHVVYASTRPFDDPTLLLQLSWEPLVPNVRINLYKEEVASDNVTPTLRLVDYTYTTSFDDWAQGFRTDGSGTGALYKDAHGDYIPNMNCPGQGSNTSAMPDPYFWFGLKDQPMWLDMYNNDGHPAHKIANDAQYKCFDGMHNWNQLQPAPYDGMYSFPSVTDRDPLTGKPTKTNCTACIPNPTVGNDPKTGLPLTATKEDLKYDPFRAGTPMLPDGKYVVEIVVPDGYELVKEEDKNILIGDNFIAPVVQQFAGLGNIFILPDQASIDAAYNANNPQNSTTDLGRTILPSHESDTGSVETYWPCVGAARVVPDYISLFPLSAEVAPFAGATRHLCDRKEVMLDDQTSVLAKFYVFTETHKAAHFTGGVTDDFASEFDPFSPQFGEKFGVPFVPVSIKDWAGNEVSRVYTDQWGLYNGLNYSTWEVNPPNPTGYGPTMMVTCMNDAGPISDGHGGTMSDPLFQEFYSQFCYELPYMPGQTGYFDTPVVPTSAFAGGYNNPDCAYPDYTPAVAKVEGDAAIGGVRGPWIAGLKGTVTSIAVTNGGSGYVSAPSVSFNNTGTGGTGATATAVIAGSVATVNLTNNTKLTNRGYSSAPIVGFTGGGGSGAVAHANMTGSVTRVNLSSNGVYSRLAPVPTVTFSGGGGSGAAGTAVMQNINATTRRVVGVTITNAGSGYSGTASVSFSQGTSVANTAAGTVVMGQSVASVTVDAGGAGYTSTPGVTFTGATTGGQAAAATATDTNSVVAINITNAGSGYGSAPSVGFTGGGGSGAAATASVETGGTLTITALGDKQVNNYKYTGPNVLNAPYNQQKVVRHYNFGDAPTDFSSFPALPAGQSYNCGSNDSTTICPYVTIGGKAMTGVMWSKTSITGTVPSGVAACPVQQQKQFGGSNAQCGELSITAANGKQSVDTVTVTIGGKQPKSVIGHTPLSPAGFGSIQQAIDSAQPGDMIIVPPGTYSEMILMWKPVRLQGVGAASSIIDANSQPAGKLNPWRQRAVCLFGLALDGTPIDGTAHPYDPSGAATCSSDMKFSVDRLPLEATVGWDATLNGNLAEQLIEPTLLGALEGAGITVLGKGVAFPANPTNDPTLKPFASDTFPTGTVLLNGSTNTTNGCGPNGLAPTNPYPGNFYCNPSSIDGLTIQDSSQGGGGIWAHAWNHELQIANNRIINNQGTMSGGITIGQGEHPDAFLAGGNGVNTVPSSCISDSDPNIPANLALPYCNNVDVNVHHNFITQNSSLGDELFSSTPAGAGGATFCNGSDYYKFNYNWVCGNMSTGDGAGVAHVGFSYDGDIEHNTILFNQSTNPTIVANGGGLLVMGAPDADPPCGLTTDQDCVSAPGTITPSDGTGPGLVINANLIQGNSADSGSGGGLRLQHVNGNDTLNFPNGAPKRNGNPVSARWPNIPTLSGAQRPQPDFQTNTPWNAISVTNNIIANNVAGYDGGGVSLLDALAVNFINNTVTSNNSTASSGVLLQTLFAPLASTQGTNCIATDGSHSCPQPAGLVSVTNSAVLAANMSQLPGGTASVTCPDNHGTNSTTSKSNCTKMSVPALWNDVFWQNRSLIIGVGGMDSKGIGGVGYTNQQNTVTVMNPNFGGNPTIAGTQTHTGDCSDTGASYWDIGVRGDASPTDHGGGTLAPQYSLFTDSNGSANGTNNKDGSANLAGTYCNGSRVPTEATVDTSLTVSPFAGWQAPPGTNESNIGLAVPPFTLQAAATTDEGNNWINLRWGPLSLDIPNPVTGQALLDATPQSGSKAIDEVPVLTGATPNPYSAAPLIDFFGNPRKTTSNSQVDAGAIETPPPPPTYSATVTPSPLNFGAVANGQSANLTLTVNNTGNQALTDLALVFSPATIFSRATVLQGGAGTCAAGTPLAGGQSCTINIHFAPANNTTYSATVNPHTLTITYSNLNNGTGAGSPVGSPVTLTGSATAIAVTPASVDFGTWGVGSASTVQTLTLRNTAGGVTPRAIGITFTGPFSRATVAQGGAGTCGATIGGNAACTINVVFTPTAVGPATGSMAISVGGTPALTVGNSPVSLTGTGAPANKTATLTPTAWSPSQTRNCPGSGLGVLACLADPSQTFTLTNTGNVTMTGIGRGALSGANVPDFAVVGLLSSCGPAGGGQLATNTTLAPGATCAVTVAFRPLTAEAAGAKTATISVTDSAGTQSVNITATAN